VIDSPTEAAAGDSAAAPPQAAEPEPGTPAEPQSVSMVGRVSYSESGAMLESADGRRLYFVVDSEVGQLIVGLCSEGETCAVTALVDGDGQIKAIQQLSAVAAAEPEAGAVPAAPAANVQPSFDCAKAASKVELLICGSHELAAADAELAGLYRNAMAAAADGEALVAAQRNWIKTVRNQCVDEPCLAEATATGSRSSRTEAGLNTAGARPAQTGSARCL
ncbi:lysozyme inhibitor LprI family protein, partial [Methylomonas koyamae]|uniref:lysozyme inhibitor LprI family protein n=1 Tax=Methylomonas koyamae TaxID=702114 RepID=UPI0012F6AC81